MAYMNQNGVEATIRGLMIAACLLALLLFGSALNIVVQVCSGQAEEERSHSYQILSATWIPAENGSMATDEPVGTGKTFYITIPALMGGGGFDYHKPALKAVLHRIAHEVNPNRHAALTTTAAISSKKAHEFTLVGARPSGTS
ncbi:MAG: hypothetical protein JSV44_02565 [Candidatus Zixiibacteriota bacterium]|nr:MAG: hypothetical protein JSV44_02565 [candidate division Zixibacteria bacterium]